MYMYAHNIMRETIDARREKERGSGEGSNKHNNYAEKKSENVEKAEHNSNLL